MTSRRQSSGMLQDESPTAAGDYMGRQSRCQQVRRGGSPARRNGECPRKKLKNPADRNTGAEAGIQKIRWRQRMRSLAPAPDTDPGPPG